MKTALVGGQVAKNNTTQHDATEVGRGNEGSNKLAVAADQALLIKKKDENYACSIILRRPKYV